MSVKEPAQAIQKLYHGCAKMPHPVTRTTRAKSISKYIIGNYKIAIIQIVLINQMKKEVELVLNTQC